MSKQYYAYIRVSTIRQGERGSSLIEQKSAIEAYAQRQGLAIIDWVEEMETAAKQGRRLFSQMMTELRSGKASGLIIHKIDRSARNLRDWADLGDLIDRGIDVRFVSDNFDLLSRGGRLSADIQAVVAADYIRNLRDEVRKGMYGRLKQGIYPFAAPVGYLNGTRVKAIDPVTGPLVRHLFERYATNTVGFEALRHEMSSIGLRTRSGKPLVPNTLSLILNNPFYMGVIRLGTTRETFAGAHQPLITQALFERVQQILRGKTVPKARKHQFLFRQMVSCGNCGRRKLTAERQKGTIYYRCHGASCRGVSWRSDALEGVVIAQVARLRVNLAGQRDFGDVVRDLSSENEAELEQRKASLTLQLQQLESRIGRLTDLLLDDTLDRATYYARKEQLLMERQSLRDEVERSSSVSPLLQLLKEFERQNPEFLRYETLLDDEKRELINIVCSNFCVTGKIVTFALRTPYREIAEREDSNECGDHRDDVRTIIAILTKSAEEKAAGGVSRIKPLAVTSLTSRRLHLDGLDGMSAAQ